MNSYFYRFSYLSPTIGATAFYYHFLITAKTDEECYVLAIKEIKEEHLKDIDQTFKKISNIPNKIEKLLENDNIIRLKHELSRSRLLDSINNGSERYFLEKSMLLNCYIDEYCIN